MVGQDFIQVVKDLRHISPQPLLRNWDCVHERVDEDVADKFQVPDVVPLGLDNLEYDGLALNLLLIEGLECGLGNKSMPLFVVLVEVSGLEASETFVGIETKAYIAS